MHESNLKLVSAFPAALRSDATRAASVFMEDPYPKMNHTFAIRVEHEVVVVPYRIYHCPPSWMSTVHLNSLQKELVACLLTRHNDGFIRQRYLAQIIRSGHPWVPPFVIQLVGEYVKEILQVIYENLGNMDRSVYVAFLAANPDFLAITEKRVMSYWDCYYRTTSRNEFVGFKLLDFFKSCSCVSV
jgi:hypothetical protein